VPVTVKVYVPPEVAETPGLDVAEVVDELRERDEGLNVTLRPGEGLALSTTVPVNPLIEFTLTPPR